MTQMTLEQALVIGIKHHRAGRLQDAEAVYRQILQAQANQPDALHLLGILACQANRFDLAVELIQQSIAVQPESAESHSNLGNALQSLGRFDEAIAAYRRAIQLNPSQAAAHNNLACALRDAGTPEEAIAEFREAINLLPDYAEAYTNLANALRDVGRLNEAIDWLHRSIALASDIPDTRITLGAVLEQQGRYAAAIDSYRDALHLAPDHVLAHLDLGIALLRNGDFAAGLPEYEWRLKRRDIQTKLAQLGQKPRWGGEPLNGRKILVIPEQGFGDIIHFARFIPEIAQRGGRVILQCPPELHALLKDFDGVDQIVPTSDSFPAFDTYCLLMSLPLVFQTRAETIPRNIPYLRPYPSAAEYWREKISQSGKSPRVGLVWTGRTDHRDNRNRSLPFSFIKDLIGRSSATFFSLQKSSSSAASQAPGLIDWTNEFHNFADTAALIANLDLVIAADTAVAHLASAMEKPVWILLPFVPDWRWMLDRNDSPWYPTMRLFRQPAIGDWRTVFEQVSKELEKLASSAH